MGEDRAKDKETTERRQYDLAERFFALQGDELPWVNSLSLTDRKLLFDEIKSHQTLHVAQGNESEAASMLDSLGNIANEDDVLVYKSQRLNISEFERRGLGGRALSMMGDLYETYRRSRMQRQRSAEIVMEYGILHDRYGDKTQALKLFKHSIGRYERTGHSYNLAAAWFNSASVLYDLGKTKASINACQKGLSLGGSEHLDLKTHLLLQRANCRERTKEIELACQDYLDAAAGYQKLGRLRQQSNILFRVGWLFGRQDRLLDARNLLNRALKISKELDYSAGLGRFHLERAQYFTSAGLPKKVEQHLQHAVMYAKLARADRTEKVARGALFRVQQNKKKPLSFYLRARAPQAKEEALAKATQGTYSHRVGDGFGTRVWRDSPRSAGKDITFLARLLAELGRRAHRPELLHQSMAVSNWQRSVRQGRRIL